MWIFINDAMFSIVQDRDNENNFLVRSRGVDEIEKVFCVEAEINTGSDYMYRASIDKDTVKLYMMDELDRIDYDNFKNSISTREPLRRRQYSKVWSAMYEFQDEQAAALGYPPRDDWWLSYKNGK